MIFERGGVRRIDGGVRVRLTPDERDVLSTIPSQLRDVFRGEAGHDELLARLFPPAYDDAAAEAEFHLTRGSELARLRSETLDRFQTSMLKGADHRGHWAVDLSWDEAHAWLQVVNDTRLVLASIDGITSEADWDAPVETSERLLLHWLGWLEEQLVQALMSTLED